jgi:uncharacterized protein (TIGR02246 family)
MKKLLYLVIMTFSAAIAASTTFAEDPLVAVPTRLGRIFSRQEAAWNSGDGAAWAADFTDDADFVNIRGDVFHGRAEIAQRHNMIFHGPFQGSHATITIRQYKDIAPGVALIETVYEVTGYKSLPPGIVPTMDKGLRTCMKYIAVEQGGQWRLVAAQNTAILPPAAPPR